jgi:4-amino-4-deoxy-L-arabinose transferase-like glycosyltransferase
MFLGSLTPETGFDALWYHLTLPKLYLSIGGIDFIPGSLFYYSAMPKVGEMLYITALSLNGDILAHLIHMMFAVLTGIAIYEIAKKFTSPYFALIAVVIFFSNIVVLWEATTAYIDLIRAFYEVMVLWGILNYFEYKDRKWLIESAFLFGLAIETKLLAFMSLPLFITAFIFFGFKKWKGSVLDVLLFSALSLLVPLAWFVFSSIHTGNPIYPIFSSYSVSIGKDTLAFPQTLTDMVTIFVSSADPISPLYLMLAPLLIIVWKKLKKEGRMLVVLSLIGILIWTLTPKTGGGRFILPYLPLFSLTLGIIIFSIRNEKLLFRMSLLSILAVFVVSLLYRGVAQMRTLPVILGIESKDSYLAKHLNFSFGDYYDTDKKMKEIIKSDKKVLLYGFHNLYYLNVPFIDSSYIQKGDTFDFIATQHASLPMRFSYWQPIYYNKITDVTLYTAGQRWVY